MSYNYYNAIADDIRDYINENGIDVNSDDFDEYDLEDDLFVDDSVTGNASGSYKCNSAQAAEWVGQNLDLLLDAIHEFGDEDIEYRRCLESPETADIYIRCHLLPSVLHDVVEELQND